MRTKLRIEFTDGTGEVVDFVDSTRVLDGVLYAYEPSGSISFGARVLGAWPLVNIKKWVRE